MLSVVESQRGGAPTALFRRADGRELYLHSRVDPLEEARFLVRDLPRQERTLYVVLGFGLGYHVKALLDSTPESSRVIVIEPDAMCLSRSVPSIIGSSACLWMQSPRLHRIAPHEPGIVPINLAEAMAKLKLLSISMVAHIPSSHTAPSFYRAVAEAIPRELPARMDGHLRGIDQMIGGELTNMWANLAHSWAAAPVSCLEGRWANRPLVIVSAGPSLSDALPLLPAAADKAFILATGTAARILVHNGVRPDAVISIDPFEWNVKHFQGWDCSEVPLVYYHRVNRGALAQHTGAAFCFLMRGEPALTGGGDAGGAPSPFRRGGTVAYSALQLAHHVGANPVVFVGQDFAFSEGRTHAFGASYLTFFDPKAPGPECFDVPGVSGRPVTTNRTYYAYLLLMQDYLLDYARAAPAVCHINTSRRGARIRGMSEERLEDVFANQPAGLQPSAREIVREAFDEGRPGPVADRAAGALTRWRTELAALLEEPPSTDFDRFFLRFKTTTLHALAPQSYDEVYYVYESRYRNAGADARAEFVDRFMTHLRAALAALSLIDLPV
jgi:hypothetical protein